MSPSFSDSPFVAARAHSALKIMCQ